MTGDDAVAAGGGELLALHRGGGRGEDEAVDLPHAAMHHRQAPPAQHDIEPARQRRHPAARLGIEAARGMGVPCDRHEVAGAARGVAAAAIAGAAAQRLLAIAHDHGDAGAAYEVEGGAGIGAVGDDVAGTDNAPGRNAAPRRRREHRPRRLEIAVGAAEDQHRPIHRQRNRMFHAADYSRSPRRRHRGRGMPAGTLTAS